jgi:hypothetical protein
MFNSSKMFWCKNQFIFEDHWQYNTLQVFCNMTKHLANDDGENNQISFQGSSSQKSSNVLASK